MEWSKTDFQEFPTGEIVWTSDFKTVRKGRWLFTPGMPLAESTWEDLNGEPITVHRWLFLEECPNGEPALPPEEPLCRGGIVGFTTTEERLNLPPGF